MLSYDEQAYKTYQTVKFKTPLWQSNMAHRQTGTNKRCNQGRIQDLARLGAGDKKGTLHHWKMLLVRVFQTRITSQEFLWNKQIKLDLNLNLT